MMIVDVSPGLRIRRRRTISVAENIIALPSTIYLQIFKRRS
jgi:hypothetical protein